MSETTYVAVGDTVIVTGHRRPERRVVVTKVGRTWITIGEGVHEQRFRIDDQTDGSKYGSPPRFYTLQQWAEKQERDEVTTYLCEQGIDLRFDSPWRGREAELAALLRTPVGKED